MAQAASDERRVVHLLRKLQSFLSREQHRAIECQGCGRTLASWHSEGSGTDVLPGFYVEGSAHYVLGPRWALPGFTRYDWSEALQGSVGGSSLRLDLAGWTMGLGAQYRFWRLSQRWVPAETGVTTGFFAAPKFTWTGRMPS